MAESLNPDFADETKSEVPSEDCKTESVPEAESNGYVALDVANLSLLATAASGEADFAAGPRTPVKKSLSRKGSQRGEERMAPNSASSVAAGDGEKGTLRFVKTAAAGVADGSGRCRRLGFRRPAPWLDPQRVLVLFATLSSLGTLILLYFTLFMGSISGSDGNAK